MPLKLTKTDQLTVHHGPPYVGVDPVEGDDLVLVALPVQRHLPLVPQAELDTEGLRDQEPQGVAVPGQDKALDHLGELWL